MSTKELKKYICLAKDAELEVYRQKRGLQIAQSSLRISLPNAKKDPSNPPERPSYPGYIWAIIGAWIFLLIISIAAELSFLIFLSIISLLFCIIGISVNHEELFHFGNLMKEYKTALTDYENRLKKEELAYNQAINIAQSNFYFAHGKIEEMKACLSVAETNLSTIYSKNIIDSKYRNLIAVSTLYEYFVTCRVSELEGPNGAYNLYEAELRQNILTNKMDSVVNQLDSIKNNQTVLYNGLVNVQQSISCIGKDISEICYNTKTIVTSSSVDAYCEKILAYNTAISIRCKL